MPGTTVQYCSRCGRAFSSGQTRYLVSIHVVADFDGVIDPSRGQGELSRLFREIENKSEQELMEEVVQRISFILCKPCRDAFARSPLGEELGDDGPRTRHVH